MRVEGFLRVFGVLLGIAGLGLGCLGFALNPTPQTLLASEHAFPPTSHPTSGFPKSGVPFLGGPFLGDSTLFGG